MYSGCVAQPPRKIANQTINISAERYFHLFHHCIILQEIYTCYIQMPRPKKQSYKQSNAVITHTFCHQSFRTSSPSSITWVSTSAATTPPNSAPPSTIDPSDIPALDSLDLSEGSVREYSPGPQENSITIDDYPEDGWDGCIQRRKRCQGSSDTGKEVQFSTVYFTLLYSRGSCSSIRLDNTKKR